MDDGLKEAIDLSVAQTDAKAENNPTAVEGTAVLAREESEEEAQEAAVAADDGPCVIF